MLDDLYKEIILDHYKSPRNRGEAANHDIKARGLNPLCGDDIEITLTVEDGVIREARFDGHGCSISQASASMLTEELLGRSVDEAIGLADKVRGMMKGEIETDGEELGDIEALRGVQKFPVRIKCATLAWNALKLGIQEHLRGSEADLSRTDDGAAIFTDE
jgi:nitrogen fixation NifU-like protein